MAIANVTLPYPDFKYADVINADEFDANNLVLSDKINEIINGNYDIVKGSNANGNYVKFPDGTMIQWFNVTYVANGITWSSVANAGTTYYYTSTTWTFPIPFTNGSPVSVQASGDLPTFGIEQHKAYNPTVSNCQVEQGVLGTDPKTKGTATCFKYLFAIGRWK